MSTLKDVARLAKVNPSTVSRVLNEDSISVKQETRERILAAVKAIDYQSNGVARSLRLKVTNTLGFLVPDIRNPFFPELIKAAEDTANEKGYNLILCNTDEDEEKEKMYIRILNQKRVDGIILATATVKNELNKFIENSKRPFVLVNRSIQGAKCRHVIIDDVYGAQLAVSHLVSLGHRKIAHIAGPLYIQTALSRLEGYRLSLNESNIPFKMEYVVESSYSKEAGYRNMKLLLEKEEPPTAVFAANDLNALGAIQAIQESGYKAPADISVIGYDNIPMTDIVSPPLTTINIPLYEMGRMATEILIRALQNKDNKEMEQVILKPCLLVRESTGPVENSRFK